MKVDKSSYNFSLLYSNLWHIAAYRRHFLKKTTQIVSNFFAFHFFESGQICDLLRPKGKSVSASGGFAPDPLL